MEDSRKAHCKRPPNTETVAERQVRHRTRMIARRSRSVNDHDKARFQRQLLKGAVTYANLSPYHPDYGSTPAKHAELKALRAAGKLKFVHKADLRVRRGGLRRQYGL